MYQSQLDKIAEGFKKRLWDKNHRLQAASVIVEIAAESEGFDSFEFFKKCGLVDERAA